MPAADVNQTRLKHVHKLGFQEGPSKVLASARAHLAFDEHREDLRVRHESQRQAKDQQHRHFQEFLAQDRRGRVAIAEDRKRYADEIQARREAYDRSKSESHLQRAAERETVRMNVAAAKQAEAKALGREKNERIAQAQERRERLLTERADVTRQNVAMIEEEHNRTLALRETQRQLAMREKRAHEEYLREVTLEHRRELEDAQIRNEEDLRRRLEAISNKAGSHHAGLDDARLFKVELDGKTRKLHDLIRVLQTRSGDTRIRNEIMALMIDIEEMMELAPGSSASATPSGAKSARFEPPDRRQSSGKSKKMMPTSKTTPASSNRTAGLSTTASSFQSTPRTFSPARSQSTPQKLSTSRSQSTPRTFNPGRSQSKANHK